MNFNTLTPDELRQVEMVRCQLRHPDLYQSLAYAGSLGMKGPPCRFCENEVRREYEKRLRCQAGIETAKRFRIAQ